MRWKGETIKDNARTTGINWNCPKQTLLKGTDRTKEDFNLESNLEQGHRRRWLENQSPILFKCSFPLGHSAANCTNLLDGPGFW